MKLSSRGGFGTILTMVLAVVFCLGVAGVWHLLFATSTAKMARRAYCGEQALELARNALVCAHFYCSEELNEKGTDLYNRIRSEKDAFSLNFGKSKLLALSDELAKKKNFNFQNVVVEVLFQRPSSLICPTEYDRYGSFRLSTAVTHRPSGVTRRLSKTYEFKVSLATVPRPFDLSTMFVANAAPYVHANSIDGHANNNLKEAWQRMCYLVFLSNYYYCQIMYAATILAKADEEYRQGANYLMNSVNQVGLVTAHFYTLEPMEPGAQGPAWFPNGPFALSSISDEVDLAKFDLVKKIGTHVEKLKTLESEWLEATTNFNTFLGVCASSPNLAMMVPFAQKYCETAKACLDEYHAMLLTYKEFQQTFHLIGGDTHKNLQPYINTMGCRDLCARATNVIGEGDEFQCGDTRSVSEKVSDLIANGLSGVLYVQNPNENLTLDLQAFKGHLVIIAEGDLTISGARVEDKSRDYLTIIALSKVTIDGPIEGGLVARNEIIAGGEIDVEGPFFVDTLGSAWMIGTVKRAPYLLAGSSAVDGTLNSVDVDYQYASLAPFARTAKVLRK